MLTWSLMQKMPSIYINISSFQLRHIFFVVVVRYNSGNRKKLRSIFSPDKLTPYPPSLARSLSLNSLALLRRALAVVGSFCPVENFLPSKLAMDLDLSPKLAKKVYGSDGGSYHAWCPSELPMLRRGNIGAAKLALAKNGLALPRYSDSAKVAYVLQGASDPPLVFVLFAATFPL